jgi:L-lactate dehydrogenase
LRFSRGKAKGELKMKVGIVGSGMVGSATGYAMGLREVASEIVFVTRTRR